MSLVLISPHHQWLHAIVTAVGYQSDFRFLQAGEGACAGHYGVLGITASADDAAVRRAYRQQAAQWHPDKWASADAAEQEHAAAKFLKVQQAYELLGEQHKRDMHDVGRGM